NRGETPVTVGALAAAADGGPGVDHAGVDDPGMVVVAARAVHGRDLGAVPGGTRQQSVVPILLGCEETTPSPGRRSAGWTCGWVPTGYPVGPGSAPSPGPRNVALTTASPNNAPSR